MNFYLVSEISNSQAHGRYSDAPTFADRAGFLINSFWVELALYFLKVNYFNASCHAVKEIFHRDTIIWQFRYFGSEGLYLKLKWLGSSGLWQLYAGLWQFISEFGLRQRSVAIPKGSLGLENLLIGFQLYLLFGAFAILWFVQEIALHKFGLDYKIYIILLKVRIRFYKVGSWICSTLLKFENICAKVSVKFRECVRRVNYTFHAYVSKSIYYVSIKVSNIRCKSSRISARQIK